MIQTFSGAAVARMLEKSQWLSIKNNLKKIGWYSDGETFSQRLMLRRPEKRHLTFSCSFAKTLSLPDTV